MAGSSGLSINSVVITIVAIAIGLVMIGSLLAPIAADVMADLTDPVSGYGADGVTWASLVGVVVLISIVGLVLVAINSYTSKK